MIRNNLRKENTKLVKEKLSMFLCCKTYLKLYYSNMLYDPKKRVYVAKSFSQKLFCQKNIC